jgi:hypothetical protein
VGIRESRLLLVRNLSCETSVSDRRGGDVPVDRPLADRVPENSGGADLNFYKAAPPFQTCSGE